RFQVTPCRRAGGRCSGRPPNPFPGHVLTGPPRAVGVPNGFRRGISIGESLRPHDGTAVTTPEGRQGVRPPPRPLRPPGTPPPTRAGRGRPRPAATPPPGTPAARLGRTARTGSGARPRLGGGSRPASSAHFSFCAPRCAATRHFVEQ